MMMTPQRDAAVVVAVAVEGVGVMRPTKITRQKPVQKPR
jgi:hypothetical protein